MSKLSLDALAQRADLVATEDLLSSINGGTENDCHPEEDDGNTTAGDAAMGEAEVQKDLIDGVMDWLGF